MTESKLRKNINICLYICFRGKMFSGEGITIGAGSWEIISQPHTRSWQRKQEVCEALNCPSPCPVMAFSIKAPCFNCFTLSSNSTSNWDHLNSFPFKQSVFKSNWKLFSRQQERNISIFLPILWNQHWCVKSRKLDEKHAN